MILGFVSGEVYNHLEISHTSWKKGLLQKRENIFLTQFFLSEIQKKSEVLIIKKIIIIARLVFEISQFFKNFSFFLAIARDWFCCNPS